MIIPSVSVCVCVCLSGDFSVAAIDFFFCLELEWRMILVDLRNHGKSSEMEGFEPPHNMFSAAKDLSELVKSEGWDWPDAVIGHSMGGKVALQFTESCARGDYGESSVCPRLVGS